MYFYETHLHTLEGSACGEVAAAEFLQLEFHLIINEQTLM